MIRLLQPVSLRSRTGRNRAGGASQGIKPKNKSRGLCMGLQRVCTTETESRPANSSGLHSSTSSSSTSTSSSSPASWTEQRSPTLLHASRTTPALTGKLLVGFLAGSGI
ncbi:hypothetical protein AOLI_G00056540 [Acnodon oligacanthus]